jgi:hypothetical protein
MLQSKDFFSYTSVGFDFQLILFTIEPDVQRAGGFLINMGLGFKIKTAAAKKHRIYAK